MSPRLTKWQREFLARMEALPPALRDGMLELMRYLENTPPAQRSCEVGHDQRGRLCITCLLCGVTSYHIKDCLNLYCGRCHLFHPLVAQARHLEEHECQDWPTARQTCAVCGKNLLGL